MMVLISVVWYCSIAVLVVVVTTVVRVISLIVLQWLYLSLFLVW